MVDLIGKANMLVNTVDPMEAQAFTQLFQSNEGANCCTDESFRIHLEGTPASAWNKSAARIFATSLIESENLVDDWETRKCIMTAFTTRLRSLRKAYIDAKKPPNVQVELKINHKRYTRKSNVCYFTVGFCCQELSNQTFTVVSSSPRGNLQIPAVKWPPGDAGSTGHRWDVKR